MSLHSAHSPGSNEAVFHQPDTLIERVDVWSASIADKTGGLSWLLKGMEEAGADFNFIIARRTPENPGSGVVFVTPIRGDREIKAASTLGFSLTRSVDAVCFEADNKPGAKRRGKHLTCPTLIEALQADSEFIENKDNAGTRDNDAKQDGQRDHIALVLPVHNPTVRATTAKKGMGIRFLTVNARSCDGFKHLLILASWQLAAIDPHQYHSACLK